jgi:hypothetical protein
LFYVSDGNANVKITSMSATPYQQEINQIKLLYSARAGGQPFDWVRVLLYALPVLFGLLFLLILKRKKKTEPKKKIKPKPKKAKKSMPRTKKKTDSFSGSFGMTHQQMIGKKMLLEIDPTGDCQKALDDFVFETKNNGEKLFIFTSANSNLHSKFSGTENVEFYLLASKASSAQQMSKKETLLPASDLSILLNTFIGIQDTKMKKTVNILFDNLSDTILLCGFEKTYKFIRWLLETTSSPKATTLFVFNPTAHNLATSSSIRGLFHMRLAYAKSGPKVGTL